MSTITFEPKGFLNHADKTNIFSHVSHVAPAGIHQKPALLVKYVYDGVLLPTDKVTYADRMDLSGDSITILGPLISTLMDIFTSIHDNCKTFKDETYPSIVSLAALVRNYSLKAGGNGVVGNSLYAKLQRLVDAAANEHDPKRAQDYKKNVNDLIRAMVQDIHALVQKSTAAQRNLQDFEEKCKKNQEYLQSHMKRMQAHLKRQEGDLKRHEGVYDTYVDSHYQYKRKCKLEGAFIWKEMAVAAQRVVDHELHKINVKKKIIKDLRSILHNVESLPPAAATMTHSVEMMIGNWNGIADDLEALRRMTNDNIRQAQRLVLSIQIKMVCSMWKALQDSAEHFISTKFT